ncbi:hypothetical protein SAMN04489761_3076 [Tenacibaculum sp. MAR_2009_124]|uniref:hypothetical protein n=1 Tax=Tenacibaculum sp. MAR_2009_124 TaxID=1250059 RepID=UPI00089B8359|nr:hypothetical protein [Tenacibaculum sp. MAR_2009_124]SEC46798.1 hypothetical protein SAMN04489761_3076 [Tenacibaculum sp. MAR_2009_124]
MGLLVGLLLGFMGGYKFATQLLTPTIQEAIKKESTLIQHDVDLNVGKVKNSEDINVSINQKPINTIEKTKAFNSCDSLSVCVLKKHLTRKQKRRLRIR